MRCSTFSAEATQRHVRFRTHEKRYEMRVTESGVTPLTVNYTEAAQLLGVSIGTLRFMVRTGLLPFVTVNRQRKIAVADLHEYVEQARAHHPQPGGDVA
jgi:excisionase family DNA binding protein